MSDDGSTTLSQWRERGTAAYKQKRWEEARSCYERALSMEDDDVGPPNKIVLIHNIALTFLREEKHREALREADKAIDIDKTWHEAYSTKAYALHGLGRTSAAIACLMKGQGLVSEGRGKLRVLEKHFDGSGGTGTGASSSSSSSSNASTSTNGGAGHTRAAGGVRS